MHMKAIDKERGQLDVSTRKQELVSKRLMSRKLTLSRASMF